MLLQGGLGGQQDFSDVEQQLFKVLKTVSWNKDVRELLSCVKRMDLLQN